MRRLNLLDEACCEVGVSAGAVAVELITPDGVVLTNKLDVTMGALVETVFCEPIGLLGVTEDGVAPDLLLPRRRGGQSVDEKARWRQLEPHPNVI